VTIKLFDGSGITTKRVEELIQKMEQFIAFGLKVKKKK